MPIGNSQRGLELSLDEAYALLDLAMTSPNKLTAHSEKAIHKLAHYCRAIEETDESSLQSIEVAG